MADEYRWPFPAESDPTPQEFVQWVENNLVRQTPAGVAGARHQTFPQDGTDDV